MGGAISLDWLGWENKNRRDTAVTPITIVISYHQSSHLPVRRINQFSFVTHGWEHRLVRTSEVPVDGGCCAHFAPHLAGDAAQFEAFVGDSLGVWLQLHTGSTAQRRCGAKEMKKPLLWTRSATAPWCLFTCRFTGRWRQWWPGTCDSMDRLAHGQSSGVFQHSVIAGKLCDSSYKC